MFFFFHIWTLRATLNFYLYILTDIYVHIFSKREKSITFFLLCLSSKVELSNKSFFYVTLWLITKVMFILSSISCSLEFWSKKSSVYQNSELKGFKNVNFFCEISNNWPNNLLGTMHTRLLNQVDNHCWQYCNAQILLQLCLNEVYFHHFQF